MGCWAWRKSKTPWLLYDIFIELTVTNSNIPDSEHLHIPVLMGGAWVHLLIKNTINHFTRAKSHLSKPGSKRNIFSLTSTCHHQFRNKRYNLPTIKATHHRTKSQQNHYFPLIIATANPSISSTSKRAPICILLPEQTPSRATSYQQPLTNQSTENQSV